jgi:hypothetical protein
MEVKLAGFVLFCFVFGERSGWLQGIRLPICLSVVPVAEDTGWGNLYGILFDSLILELLSCSYY